MIIVAVFVAVVFLALAALYARTVFKFLRWFIRELVATPAAIRGNLRRKRGRHDMEARWSARRAEREADGDKSFIGGFGDLKRHPRR